MLALAADGSLRDALSLLDQAIAYCGGGAVEEQSVAMMLGTIDRDHVGDCCSLLATEDGPGIIDTVADLDEQFPDYSRLLEDLARMLQRIAVYQVVGKRDRQRRRIRRARRLAELAGAVQCRPDVQLYLPDGT